MDKVDLAILHGYIVEFYPHATEDNVFYADYPENIFLGLENLTVQYYIYKGEIIRTAKDTNYTVPVKDYEIRPFIVSDVCLRAKDRNILPKYIKGYDRDLEQAKMFSLLPKPTRTAEEKSLIGELTEIIQGGPKSSNPSIKKFLKFYQGDKK